MHGENSIFVSPSVKLGWAVKRGASEAETLVVVRIIARMRAIAVIRVDGVDPFSKDRKVFVAARPLDRDGRSHDPARAIRRPPEHGISFLRRAPEDAAANRPKLTVFYLGVPDTTPEFPGQREAEAYLEKMLHVQ